MIYGQQGMEDLALTIYKTSNMDLFGMTLTPSSKLIET